MPITKNHRKPITSIIVAAADNNVIGKDNKMPWHIPEDFKHFKETTLGKPCIMGRKTYESIFDRLGKPLPGRTSIVITRSPPYPPVNGGGNAHNENEKNTEKHPPASGGLNKTSPPTSGGLNKTSPPASGGLHKTSPPVNGGEGADASSGRGGGEVLFTTSLEEAIEKAKEETSDEIMVIGGAQIYALALPFASRIYLTRVHQSPDGDAFFPELGEEWKEVKGVDHDGYSFLTFERTVIPSGLSAEALAQAEVEGS